MLVTRLPDRKIVWRVIGIEYLKARLLQKLTDQKRMTDGREGGIDRELKSEIFLVVRIFFI